MFSDLYSLFHLQIPRHQQLGPKCAHVLKPTLPRLWQDYFWSFCTRLWGSRAIDADKVQHEAKVAAKGYLDQLKATGLIS